MRTLLAICLVVPTAALGQTVRVEPGAGVAGHFGTWTVSYEVGAGGLAEGGGLRVQLPDTWHAGERNSANRLQATDPTGDHYVSARVSRAGVRVATEVESETADYLVKSSRRGLDGREERYVFVVRVTLEAGGLSAGDTVAVVYGDRSGGSRGMRAAIVSTPPEPILVAVDRSGRGGFVRVAHDATLVAAAGVATELRLTGPSTLVVGEPAVLHVAAVDPFANPAPIPETINLHVVDGEADLPATTGLLAGRGYRTVTFTPRRDGILRLAADTRERLLRARSNPMLVHRDPPAARVYWGDLHSHTGHSFDGVGHAAFEYARYVSGLDFHAVTDHSQAAVDGFTRGLGPHVWAAHGRETDAHHAPGEFVTLHAYEASFPAPHGHHNVYFRGAPGPLLAPQRVGLPEVWAALAAGEALTVPHHTGKFPGPLHTLDHDPGFRRNFEIYSAHGLSETFDPAHPLAFEQSDFTNASTSAPDGLFAQDAWARGLVLSTIAASDDHRAHPGQPHWGLAAVTAPALTRDAVFDALYHRRTYGTTGARVLLDFTVNGEPMGGSTTTAGAPRLAITAHGTDLIDSVEILRYSDADGGFTEVAHLQPNAIDVSWTGRDLAFRDRAVYYVRLRQRREVRGRVVMAWSSPVWVTRSTAP